MAFKGIAVGAVVFLLLAGGSGTARGQESAAARAQDAGYPRQISRGRVTLEMAPRWEDSVLVVRVSANTHSVALTELKLGELMRLVIGEKEIAPVRAGTLSGHHSAVDVVFRLASRPSTFSVKVRDVPDVPLRVLSWPPESGPR